MSTERMPRYPLLVPGYVPARLRRPARALVRTLALGVALGFAFGVVLSGCALGPDFEQPAAPASTGYGGSPAPGAAPTGLSYTTGQAVAADWWRVFGVHDLDALVDQAVRDNPSLQAAQAALQRSQDTLRAGYGAFFPQVGLSLGATRAQSAPLVQGSSLPGSIYSVVTAGASVSYTLDVFGLQRRTVEGLQAQVQEQEQVARAGYLSLTANVVNTAIARAAYTAQIDAVRDMQDIVEAQMRLTQAQVQAGTLTPSALLALQGTRDTLDATQQALRQRRAQTVHLLASLLGQETGQAQVADIDLTALAQASDLPLSLPSQLVRQRPDILAAQAQLHEASAAIGVATAAMLPSVTLGASGGVAGSGLADLSNGNGENYWSVGPTVSVPVFEGGAQWYARAAAVDAYHQAQAQYRQTVLAALAQVSDTLAALAHDVRTQRDWQSALAAAQETERLTGISVRAGVAGEADLLAARLQTLQARQSWIQALAQRQQDTVALYAALGGGWWSTPADGGGVNVGTAVGGKANGSKANGGQP